MNATAVLSTTSTPQTTAAEVLAPAATPQTPPAAGAPPEKVSPKIHLLIQRERAAVDAERKARERERTISDREAKLNEFESVKENKLKALELLGISIEELNQLVLNDGKATPDMAVQSLAKEVQSLKESQEADKQAQTEKEKQDEIKANEKAISTFKTQITAQLKEKADRYELLAFDYPDDGGMQIVYDVIDEHYNQTLKAAQEKSLEADPEADTSDIRGELMTVDQAADKCELYLEQKYQKAKGLKKVSFLATRRDPPATKPKTQPSQTPKTLSNTLAAAPSAPKASTGILTDAERIQKAIAYAKGLRP